MPRPTVVYRLMLLGPVLFLAAIGIESRTFDDGFVPISHSGTQTARINAYIPVLKRTVDLVDSSALGDEQTLTQVAEAWVSGMREGKLREVNPAAYDDTSADGAKELIFRTRTNLARRLTHYAKRLAKNSADQAADQFILAAEVCEVAKFSDIGSVMAAATEQASIVRKLREVTPLLSPSARKTIAAAVLHILENQRSISALVAQSRTQYIEWCRRTGREPLDIEATRPTASNPRPKADLVASQEGPIPTFMSRSGTAEDRQNELVNELRAVFKELGH